MQHAWNYEKSFQNFYQNTGRYYLEYFGVSRKMVLAWICEKYYMRLCGMDLTVLAGSVNKIMNLQVP
jgi:hypothetical protein